MIKDVILYTMQSTTVVGSEGPKYPTLVSDGGDQLDPGGEPGYSWTDINNIKIEDGQYAIVSSPQYAGISQNLFSSGYGFNIPSNAIINGVTVTIRKSGPGLTKTYDVNVYLAVGGTIIGENKANADEWDTTFQDSIYGGNTDLRGNELTPQIINSSDFGLAIACTVKGGFYDPTISRVDSVKIKVDYAYFIN